MDPITKQNQMEGYRDISKRGPQDRLGVHQMTVIDHLNLEVRVMRVKAHNEMLSKQFLVQTMWQNHPN